MNHEYKIGKVSSVTGISADTLRAWERRYAAVAPARTDGGGRLYSVEDVARLKLIKQLIDDGDSIGTLATLTYDELKSRAGDATVQPADLPTEQPPLKTIVIGSTLPARLDRDRSALHGMELLGGFQSVSAFTASATSPKVDALIIEIPTLHDNTALELADLFGRLNLLHAFVIYRFATSSAKSRLAKTTCTLLRAPVDTATLNELCLSVSGTRQRLDQQPEPDLRAPHSTNLPRRFDDATLEKIAAMTPVIQCECPRHLAELLSNLSAFEQYSTECENRNEQDAELHAYLNRSAAQARMLIEEALAKVLEIENINL